MESGREGSPDWLRSFQTPVQTLTTLSSSSPSSSPLREVHGTSRKASNASPEEGEQQSKLESHKKGSQTILLSDSGEETPRKPPSKSKSTRSRKKGELDASAEGKRPLNLKPNEGLNPVSKVKSEFHMEEDGEEGNGTDVSMLKIKEDQPVVEKGDADKEEVGIDDTMGVEEDPPEKRTQPRVASRLPLLISDKLQCSKALLECEGETLDLSGDIGAVGRLIVSGTSTDDNEVLLDLKGTIYKTTIVPSYTFCVVSFGQTEAKIEAVMSDFVQLQPHSNVYETETMVEGTLDGFLFDSDDEGDRMNAVLGPQIDQKNEATDIADEKPTKKKKPDTASGGTKRKAKPAVKPVKKGKSSSAKKPKTSKK